MAKGSVRKKGKKWYYRFYVEDASGRRVQREFVGSTNKAETEAMLRRAMEEYESKHYLAKPKRMTLGELLDLWAEEELKPGSLSNGTVIAYLGTVRRLKGQAIAERTLKSITPEHLQEFIDWLCFGPKGRDGQLKGPISVGYRGIYAAVLQHVFRFAVFPKRLMNYNPMQYVLLREKSEEVDLFSEEGAVISTKTLPRDAYRALIIWLKKKKNPAILPIQIAYHTGLRIGEVCGLTWQDIDLEGRCLRVQRSVRYNGERKRHEIGTTKRKRMRVVDFGDSLALILQSARAEQLRNQALNGENHRYCFYRAVQEYGRIYYELYVLPKREPVPDDYHQVDFVCIRKNGALEYPNTIELVCRTAKKQIPGLQDFSFHMLRHTYTSNLLRCGASPKDVQELLGHADISTTMNVYAHSSHESKRASARLLDEMIGAIAR